MPCPRCPHENRPQAKFCEECGTPLTAANPSSPSAPSYGEITSALSEALGQQKATAELLQARNRELTESLEQQTATSEILRVIASSPTDVQPVLDAVAENAARLCAAYDAIILRLDGDVLRRVAHHGPIPSDPGLVMSATRRGTVAGRAVLDRQPIHVADLQAETEEFPEGSTFARRNGHRSLLSVPLLRAGAAIGAITIRRTEVQPFTEKQIGLLQTFADQAVIAIENVRLFTELQEKNRALTEAHGQVTESLEQQTATAEILRVIASSPTDLQPVLEAVAENAARVCGASDSSITLLEGERLRLVTHHGSLRRTLAIGDTYPATRGTVAGRAVIDQRTIHVEDIVAAEAEFPELVSRTRQAGIATRTILATPLLRESTPLGAIFIARPKVHPFSAKQIALLETFANQAVIAIENVRLFTELQEKNRVVIEAHAQVTESLEQQTATAEILRVISRSPTDIQPVLDAVAESAARLCESSDTEIFRRHGDRLLLVAHHGPIPSRALAVPLVRGAFNGRAVLDGRTLHVADLQSEVAEFPRGSELARQHGTRAQLSVPLMREGTAIGTISLRRTEARLFTERQVALLQTFANQAVIAIENVRLFQELETRNRDLTEALEQQTATGEILRVIASSPTDLQPVMDTIAKNTARLCEAVDAHIYRVHDDVLRLMASHGLVPSAPEVPIRRGNVSGRAVLDRRTIHVRDLAEQVDTEFLDAKATQARYGTRTLLATPLLREGLPIGAILIRRTEVRPFTEKQTQLLETFAAQAVIASENVRLFNELQEKNRALTEAHAQVTEALEQQTATAEILRVIAGSPTDVQPVFEAIARSAVQLCEAVNGGVYRFDGRLIHLAAQHGYSPESVEANERVFPRPPDRGSVSGRAILTRTVVHVDIAEDPEYELDAIVQTGLRAVLTVPMLRDGDPIGAIAVTREEGRFFSETQIALLI